MGKQGRKDKVTFTYRTEEEAQQVSALEDFLFGGTAARKLLVQPSEEREGGISIADLVKQAAEAPSSDEGDDGDDDGLLFVEDREGADDAALDDEAAGPGPGSEALQQEDAAAGSKRARAPAWTDASEAALTVPVGAVARLRKLRQFKQQEALEGEAYTAALRKQHALMNPRTTWAQQPKGSKGRRSGGAGEQAAAAAGRHQDVDDSAEPDESAAQALLRSGSGLLLHGRGGGGGLLAPGAIEMSRLRDANCGSPSDAVVQALQWHPNGQLMLAGGFDKRLKLFQVDGLRNPLVQSLFLADCPIHTAAFAAGGSCVVAAGRRPFYYVADLNTGQLDRVVVPPCLNLAPSGAPSNKALPIPSPVSSSGGKAKKQRTSSSKGAAPGSRSGSGPGSTGGIGMKSCESFVASPDPNGDLLAFLGDSGHIGLVSLASRSAVGALKMSGSARAAAFSSDGRSLITAGGDGVLYTWDLRSQRCLHQQRDEGVVSCSALALSPDGAYLATGDSMGVVNVYSRPAGLLVPLAAAQDSSERLSTGRATKPLKSLMNLTTAVDSLAFSHDSQLLLMGSRLKREGLRLVHLPSASVYANWPTSRSPLQYVHAAAFSPHSGFLGVGNAKGRVLLYRLHHYPSV